MLFLFKIRDCTSSIVFKKRLIRKREQFCVKTKGEHTRVQPNTKIIHFYECRANSAVIKMSKLLQKKIIYLTVDNKRYKFTETIELMIPSTSAIIDLTQDEPMEPNREATPSNQIDSTSTPQRNQSPTNHSNNDAIVLPQQLPDSRNERSLPRTPSRDSQRYSSPYQSPTHRSPYISPFNTPTRRSPYIPISSPLNTPQRRSSISPRFSSMYSPIGSNSEI